MAFRSRQDIASSPSTAQRGYGYAHQATSRWQRAEYVATGVDHFKFVVSYTVGV
jgi:hypothetical protein